MTFLIYIREGASSKRYRYADSHDLYINIQWCINETQQNFILFIIVLGQHVSILIESFSGLSKIQIVT